MSDSARQIDSWNTLQLKEGAYTRVEYDLTTEKPKLYAVDQQGEPSEENEVKVWKRHGYMVFCVKGEQNYLLKADGKKLSLEMTSDKPDINRLEDCYWFLTKSTARSQQFRIHSKDDPGLCVIIKEIDRQWLFDLGDLTSLTSSVAVFIAQTKISW